MRAKITAGINTRGWTADPNRPILRCDGMTLRIPRKRLFISDGVTTVKVHTWTKLPTPALAREILEITAPERARRKASLEVQ